MTRGSVMAVTEQVFASAFTFCLFWSVVRVLSPEELGLYSAYFSLNQSFALFLFGLVLLPMASASGPSWHKEVGIAVVLLVVLLVVFAAAAPFVMCCLSSFDGKVNGATWALAVGFFGAQCLYDASRWLGIRLRGVAAIVPVTVARFIVVICSLWWMYERAPHAQEVMLLQTAVNAGSFLCLAVLQLGCWKSIRLAWPGKLARKHMSTFGNAASLFLNNLAVVAMMDRGMGADGLAAFQSVRSATNPVGMISQVLDNHYSADLARAGREAGSSRRAIQVATAIAMCCMCVAVVFGRPIMAALFGEELVGHWPFVPLLLLASILHALTRPIFVKWRLAGDSGALNRYSLILLGVALPAIVVLGSLGWTMVMVGVYSVLPLCALGVGGLHRTTRLSEKGNE